MLVALFASFKNIIVNPVPVNSTSVLECLYLLGSEACSNISECADIWCASISATKHTRRWIIPAIASRHIVPSCRSRRWILDVKRMLRP